MSRGARSSAAGKSLTQPDGGEGCSGSATGYPVTVPRKEAVPPRRDTANARGDEQKPSQAGLVGRVCNSRQSPLSIIGQAGILGARVRKVVGLTPGDPLRVQLRTERTARGDHRAAEVSRGHSSRRKRAAVE